MKKLLMILFAGVFFSLAQASPVNAKAVVTESANIKIIIDGKFRTYDNVPVIVNGRTLLPLRAIFTDLGVKNDNAHIMWNSKEKSVTVLKDNTKLYLKIGSKSVKINGKSDVIDVEPIIHKNRTYMPVRFVSQSFGKKVFWDSKTKAVLIRDEVEFNKIKAIGEKSDLAAAAQNKVKTINNFKMVANGAEFVSSATEEIDMQNKVKHMVEEENGEVTEYYYANNKVYARFGTNGSWEIGQLSDAEYNNEFGNTKDEAEANIFNASLYIAESGNSDEIVLEGDIVSNDFPNSESVKMHAKIVLDKTTYRSKSFTATGSGILPDTNIPYTFNASIVYSNLSEDFKIELPEDLKNTTQL